jgi:acyl-CoA dehydrogenase
MDFDLSKDQKMLQDSVKEYLRDKIAPIADDYDRKGPMGKKEAEYFLKKLEPFGYLGTHVPKKYGGPGMSHVDWAIIFEELRGAYASLGGIVGITSATAGGLSRTDNEKIKDNTLTGLLSGEKIGCMAITEPDVGSDASAIKTEAIPGKDHYTVNGTKTWISNGTIADYVILVATVDPSLGPRGICQLLVEKKISPFEANEIPKMGLKSFPTAELVFNNCMVPKENLLRSPGEGLKSALSDLTFARCNAAIASVGISQAALNAAIKYAKSRTQFGKAIGKFQLIQQMIAEMAAEVDASRLLTYRALHMFDKGRIPIKEASIAKAYATEAGVRVASKAIQIHGAYGLSEEYPVERYFRDARCYTIPDGTTQMQQLIIGRETLGMSAIY